jgi:hypothetical protein
VVRSYLGQERYEEEGVGIADDYTDADGIASLDFWQAQAKARLRWKERAAASTRLGPYTVAAAIKDYLAHLEHKGRSASDAKMRLDAHVLLKLGNMGNMEVAALTADRLRRWQNDLVRTPPRKRAKPGAAQAYYDQPENDDNRRKRRATANRVHGQSVPVERVEGD